MLESKRRRPCFSNFNFDSLRKTWSGIFRTLFPDTKSVSRGLFRLGEGELSRGLDEKVPENVQPFDTTMTEERPKTRDEVFAESHFEWVKTDRAGDICNFKEMEVENGIEYVSFTDGSRIKMEFIGDIVLMHNNPHEILGSVEPVKKLSMEESLFGDLPISVSNETIETPLLHPSDEAKPTKTEITAIDPVISILEKGKKKVEKLSLSISVKIPSPDLYNVIKENFDNTDEVLLDSVMEQIQGSMLREAVKKELQALYSKKKKN